MFTVERKTAETPQAEGGGRWQVCSPETVANFSATAYFFGRDLHQSLKAPVGLIDASWGGTPIEAWTSLDAQQSLPALAPLMEIWRKRTAAPFDEEQAQVRHEIKNDTIILKFTHTGGGLKSKDAELKGFAIAGEDRKWVWATARIDGDQVIVSSPEVKAPVAVRYAWADNPRAPLINGAGLPASPFRTDDW